MQVGLVGAAASGKTTLFELLSNTRGAFLSPDQANTATVDVPDQRVDNLSNLFQPQRTVYAQISFTDINRLAPGDRENNPRALAHLKLMDALAVVVNGFMSDRSGRTLESELDFVLSELILSDLDQVERKQDRLKKNSKPVSLGGMPEPDVFSALGEALEANTLLSSLKTLPPDVWKELNSFSFLTKKPLFIVVNLSEEHGQAGLPGLDDFEPAAKTRGFPVVRIYAKLEKDLQELSPEDRKTFAAEYPFPLDGKTAFIRQAYRTAGLISFFTVGKDEVRAWTIPEACPVREAAGVIHKDFTNYFVRAEVIPYDRLLECGSEHEAAKRGWLRSEKKEYPVLDGDILHILANK